MANLAKTVANNVNLALKPLRVKLVRDAGLSYIPGKQTIAAAKAAQLPVDRYIDKTYRWPNFLTAPKLFVEHLQTLGALDKSTDRLQICEIGPGSGRFISALLDVCQPQQYEIYEPDRAWANWLKAEYGVIIREGQDWETLSQTESASMDLVHAHSTFVYLSVLTACSYFYDIARVTKPGGFVAFDIISEESLDTATIAEWLATPARFPVLLPRAYVVNLFANKGFSLADESLAIGNVGSIKSHHLFFQKQLN